MRDLLRITPGMKLQSCFSAEAMAEEVRSALADAVGRDYYEGVEVDCLDIDEAAAIRPLLTEREAALVEFLWPC